MIKPWVEWKAIATMVAKDGRIELRDWGLLLLLSVLWGGSFSFNGVVLKELPPLTVVFVRVVLASLMLLPLLRLYRLSFHPAFRAGCPSSQWPSSTMSCRSR